MDNPREIRGTVTYTLALGKEPVGYYEIGDNPYGFRFMLTIRPTWLQRKAMALVFGWKWSDINLKEKAP